MNRGRKLLFALVMSLLLMLMATSALADSLRFGTVDGGSTVNLRESASTQSRRLRTYPRGTWLRIVGDYGDWLRVVGPDGLTGYMKRDFVYVSAAAKGIIGIVNVSDYLNLRASANSSGRVLGTYGDGTPCILLSEMGDWYHVSVDGKAGYFKASFIEKKYMTYSTDVATVVSKNGGAVNLRKGPGKEYGVVSSVKNGAYVMIIQEGDGWWKVSANGNVGYMDEGFLKDGIITKQPSSGGTTSGGTSSGSSSSGSSNGGFAVVSNPGANEKLNLRESASKKARSIGKYGNGVQVTVLEQGNVWCKVRVDGKTGYMMTEFLKFYGLSGAATATVSHPDRTFVYLRNGPSQSTGRVLQKVPHGTKVTILNPGSTWTKVSYNGRTGYMMTRFLKK